jgi:two-component system, LuxR family, sensor histidine kinase DctS
VLVSGRIGAGFPVGYRLKTVRLAPKTFIRGRRRTPKIRFLMRSKFSIHEGLLAAFILGIATLMWLLYRHELELQRNDLVRDIAVAEKFLSDRLDSDQSFVEQLAREKGEGALPREQFETRVSVRALESPHWIAVTWTEPNLNTLWSAPGARAQSDLARARPPFAEQERVMRLAGSTGRATYSIPYFAPDGGAYIEYSVPITSGSVYLGTMNNLMSLTTFAKTLLPDWFLTKYDLSITDSFGNTVSRAGAIVDRGEGYMTQSQRLALPWRDLHLNVTARQRGSTLAAVTVATTILALTGLIAWSFYSLRREGARRLASENSMKAVNERFETVLDSLNVAVYVSDAFTDELLYANEHFREMFPRFSGNEVKGFESSFNPAFTSLFNSDPEDFRTVFKHECHHLPSNRWFITRVRRVRWVDGRAARLHTLGDVTDRVEAERTKRTQQERLMLTSRLMTAGEMASTLAHEINQPLAAITNYLNGCLQRLRGGEQSVNELAPAIEKASAQAERAGTIINRVREFVRSRDPRREALDVRSLLDDVVRFAEPDPSKPTLSFVQEIGKGLPDVFADRIMIEQVLLNLIRNAREAMAALPLEGRRLTLRAVQSSPQFVNFSVSDVGTGLAPEVAENLFSPFMTTKTDGMGMGLSICRSIIEYHEGQMRYVPNVPRGASFEFSLPIASDE